MLAERLKALRGRPNATVRVRVKGSYLPPIVHARVGEPLRIVFRREETASCSEQVVFPAFGKSAMLPPFEDVTVELVPERAGEYEFTCRLGMLRGRLVVDGDGAGGSASPDQEATAALRRPWRRRVAGEHSDTVLLAFVAWLCSLPLLLLVAVPFVGWRSAGLLTLIWFGVVASVCFVICLRRVGRAGSAHRPDAELRELPAVLPRPSSHRPTR